MMPTRLHDGLSISLLQWSRMADVKDVRSILVRISDGEDIHQIFHYLQNAGLNDAKIVTPSCIIGHVTPDVITQVVRCYGVCSVTED